MNTIKSALGLCAVAGFVFAPFSSASAAPSCEKATKGLQKKQAKKEKFETVVVPKKLSKFDKQIESKQKVVDKACAPPPEENPPEGGGENTENPAPPAE